MAFFVAVFVLLSSNLAQRLESRRRSVFVLLSSNLAQRLESRRTAALDASLGTRRDFAPHHRARIDSRDVVASIGQALQHLAHIA